LAAVPGGTIAVYTKKGGDNKTTDPNFKGLPRALLVGYSMPQGILFAELPGEIPANEAEDLRTTLYWKPYVLTDKETRRVNVDFFNNDISRKLRIVLEGFNEDGKLTHIERSFNKGFCHANFRHYRPSGIPGASGLPGAL
jgi:hypothetical protein